MRTLPLLMALACSSPLASAPDTNTDTDTDTAQTDPNQVISLTTQDGVTLQADYLAASAGAPAVVLVHMIPPANDRSGWPVAFREALHSQGWSVLSVDRRGAGESGGEAVDAYQGEQGKFDVAACVDHLVAAQAGPIVIFGASNGTTSMIDYTAWAAAEGHRQPVGLAYLSGGTYTENQTLVVDLPPVPMAFLYPPSESEWPESQRAHDPGSWTFTAYPDGAHGTRLFGTSQASAVQSDLIAFVDRALAAQ